MGIPGRAAQRYQSSTFGAAPKGPEVAVMQQVPFNLYNVPGPRVTTSEFEKLRAFVAHFPGGQQSLRDLDRVGDVLRRRPLACPHLLERADRLANEEDRWCWTLWVWQEQIAALREGQVAARPTPACNLCGQPTGCWCDGLGEIPCGRANANRSSMSAGSVGRRLMSAGQSHVRVHGRQWPRQSTGRPLVEASENNKKLGHLIRGKSQEGSC